MSIRVAARRCCVGAAIAVMLHLTTAAAGAQTGTRSTSTARWEGGIAAAWLGPVPLGSSSATLTTPGGNRLTVFNASSRFAPGLGVDVQIGRPLARRLAFEVSTSWARVDLETAITDDVEDVADVRLINRASRVSAEGAVLFTLAGHDRRVLYALAGGGWMREMPSGVMIGTDGAVGKVGAGMKYWWRRPGQMRPGGARAVGLRVEARAVSRSRGVSVGASRVRVAPGVLAGIIFGL